MEKTMAKAANFEFWEVTILQIGLLSPSQGMRLGYQLPKAAGYHAQA